MTKNILKILAVFVIGAMGGIFADQILWPYFIERPLFYQYNLNPSSGNIIEKKEIIIQENIALQQAIERVEKTVISVKTETSRGKNTEGSGLILTSDGLAVTLAELLPSGSKPQIFWEGEKLPFQVLKKDLKNNLALLKIEKNNLPTIGFGDGGKLKLGQRVFLLGAVMEEGQFRKIVNEGIVRTFSEDFIQTNISEKSILSGSPLFDIEGKVLGLNKVLQTGEIITIPIKKIQEFTGL